jgi:hypothetical protein
VTDLERFDQVLAELGTIMKELYVIGLSDDVVLIGAQVVALEQRSRNAPPFRLSLPGGLEIVRSFSLEPDLVIDTEDLDRLDLLPDALRRCGFERGKRPGRPSSWSKTLDDGFVIEIDLFFTADCGEDVLPTPMTRLRGAPSLRVHKIDLDDRLSINVPDAHAYLSLKLEAKLRIRPEHTKDSLDLFSYVQVVGALKINAALQRAGADGERVRQDLRGLFEREDSPGVKDVLEAVGSELAPEERALLARAILDAFAPILQDGSAPLSQD